MGETSSRCVLLSSSFIHPNNMSVVFIFFILFSLLVTGIIRYLPHHISVMQRRTIYYIWGRTSTAVSSGDDRAFLTLVNELASETLKTEL